MGRKSTKKIVRMAKMLPNPVKWVEVVSPEEFRESRLFQSISAKMKSDTRHTFVFQDNAGQLVEHDIYRLVCADTALSVHSIMESSIVCVKMHYRDGSWEYGFKYAQHKMVVDRNKRVLKPIYLKDGYIDENTGEVVDCYSSSQDFTFVPLKVLKRLSFYNEDMLERVKAASLQQNDNHPHCEVIDEERMVCETINSPYASRQCMKFSVPPLPGKPSNIGKMAWAEWIAIDVVFKQYQQACHDIQYEWYYPFDDDTRQIVIANGDGTDNRRPPRFLKYSYLKSCYEDVCRDKVVYEVYPASSLLRIVDAWNEDEVWNNMQATISGNI